jgi:hypothetical protein
MIVMMSCLYQKNTMQLLGPPANCWATQVKSVTFLSSWATEIQTASGIDKHKA